MNWKREWWKIVLAVGLFLVCLCLPVGPEPSGHAVTEGLGLVQWYAQEQVILRLLPALFVAGAITTFIGPAWIMKYLGAGANKLAAYTVAAVSGTVLSVCSCKVLPLFAGIYRLGAGLGPATTFLYVGPAISILALVLTARVLGFQLAAARAIAAVGLSLVIGVAMQLMFRREEADRMAAAPAPVATEPKRKPWQTAVLFVPLVGVLVSANCCEPDPAQSWTAALVAPRWIASGALAAIFAVAMVRWLGLSWWKVVLAAVPTAALAILFPREPVFAGAAAIVGLSALIAPDRGEAGEWFAATWDFTKQMLPLLAVGVFVAGCLFGRVGNEGLIPRRFVEMLLGASPEAFLAGAGLTGGTWEAAVRAVWPLWTNLFAAVLGTVTYFATLTEVPIVQGLETAGMGRGPALTLLLAGPAVSLPTVLVVRSIMGTRKTLVYVLLVVVLSAAAGTIYGTWWG